MPKWAQSTAYLRSFAIGRHLDLKTGGKLRVVFWGVEDPVGELWYRPHKLVWEESVKLVTAQFGFEHPYCDMPQWEVLEYNRGVKGFVYMSPLPVLDLVYIPHPDAKYYTSEEREEVKQKIKERRTWSDDEQAGKVKKGLREPKAK